jgi:hypothetical protein
MIGRGRQGAVYLYEITEQDLLLDANLLQRYRPGNVLLFADKRGICLGAELAIAEDLAAAREYLATRAQTGSSQPGRETAHDESLRSLTEKIAQRDEFLHELAESLKVQKQDNEQLIAQLEQLRTQLVESKPLCAPDAPNACVSKESAADTVGASGTTGTTDTAVPSGTAGVSDASASDTPSTPKVLTTTSGKKIHVLHEFPAPSKRLRGTRGLRLLVRMSRIAGALLLMLLFFTCMSTVATARANDISYGEALDLITKGFGLS